jgi:hypothetical protein
VHRFKCLDSIVLLHEILAKMKMATGGHPHFDNDHKVFRIKAIPS